MINNLEDVILLLSDEELLKDNAISREEFTLDNLLRMLDMKEELYSFCTFLNWREDFSLSEKE